MATNHTFPQTGDTNDAANYGQYLGRENISQYVEEGLTFTPDYSVPAVTVSAGKAYVLAESAHASRANIDRLYGVDYMLEVEETTVSLSVGTKNYIWLDPNVGADNSPNIMVTTGSSAPTTPSLLLGTVHTGDETIVETNRAPDVTANTVRAAEGIMAADTIQDVTVPADYTMFVGSNFSVNGEATVDGTLTTVEHPAEVEQFGVVRAGQALMSKNNIPSGETVDVPAGYTMFVSEDFTGEENVTGDGNLVRVNNTDRVQTSHTVTASTGGQPAYSGTHVTNFVETTQPFDVIVTPAADVSVAFAYNTTVSKHWDGSSWKVEVVINWDTDPGQNIDFTVEVRKK